MTKCFCCLVLVGMLSACAVVEPYDCLAWRYQESNLGHGLGVKHCVTFLLR